MLKLWIDEDNLIDVGSSESLVRSAADGTVIADATITAQLKNEGLTASVGSSITLTPTATAGIYQGVLTAADAALLEQFAYYWLEITVTGSTTGFRRVKCQATWHEEQP